MRGPPASDRQRIFLHLGEVFVSPTPYAVTTILGSCVSVCLWDQGRAQGGMNHYLLPEEPIGQQSSRFGTGAIRRLLELLRSAGSRPDSLVAKLFGGASGLFQGLPPRNFGVHNVDVAERLLAEAEIPVVARDVGGHRGRKLVFHTDDGRAWVQAI